MKDLGHIEGGAIMSQTAKRSVKISPNLARAFWRANISLAIKLLLVWFLVSFGAGILFRDWLNQFSIGEAPLGFWFAQQGSIYVFVALIFIYVRLMGNIERQYGLSDEPYDYGETPAEQQLQQYRKKPSGNRLEESALDPIPKHDPNSRTDPDGFVKPTDPTNDSSEANQTDEPHQKQKAPEKPAKGDIFGSNKNDDEWGA